MLAMLTPPEKAIASATELVVLTEFPEIAESVIRVV